MESINLLQSFGLTSDGRLVSVEDVGRGKTCECCCPECGEVLIARQGDVRAWHFAHASGGDCQGAAEGALHMAAKQLVVQEKHILVPALEAQESHRLVDGRLGEVSLVRPAETWELSGIREEVSVGAYRIDVAGDYAGHPVFIEIAVTHAVEESKRDALAGLGIRCFEVTLNPYLHATWTWEILRQEVLECPGNRRRISHPELDQLREQARCEAIAKAFGGRYKGAPYRNWIIPVGAKAALLEQLDRIGAARER